MKLKLYILATFVLTATTLYGQDVHKCDRAILISINDKIGQLTQKQIAEFLMTFGKECRNNIEYSEWSNELLFSLLKAQTELTLKTIEKEKKSIEIEDIFDDLSKPILDAVDLKGLIAKIEKVKMNTRLKNEIIEKLKVADGKPN